MQRPPIVNRFDVFKQDFRKDTGLDWDSNIQTYINYFNARVQDQIAQAENIYLGDILNDLSLIKKFLDPTSKM